MKLINMLVNNISEQWNILKEKILFSFQVKLVVSEKIEQGISRIKSGL